MDSPHIQKYNVPMTKEETLAAIQARHSVRHYTEQKMGEDLILHLKALIDQCNRESGLHIQLITDEPNAFDFILAKYGKFSGVRNYIAFVGKNDDMFDELCGYYGEKIILEAQHLGLNTCWVGLSYSKKKTQATINEGETLRLVASIGYGKTQGVVRKSKKFDDVAKCQGEAPLWFKQGVEAALLAPTAINQQKFKFILSGNTVKAKNGWGFYAKVDLGIAKYHFEAIAGKENFSWAE